MIGWLVALGVWVAALLAVCWYLLPAPLNGASIFALVVMVAMVAPIVNGIVAKIEEKTR